MIFVWLGLTIVFALIEGATAQLTTIWFALGSAIAFVVAVCGVKSANLQRGKHQAQRLASAQHFLHQHRSDTMAAR